MEAEENGDQEERKAANVDISLLAKQPIGGG